MATYLIVDVETAPHPDAPMWADPVKVDSKLLAPIKPDSRLVDPVKVAANLKDVERREAERVEELAAAIAEKEGERGLDPDCNCVVAIGWHVVGHAEPQCEVMSNELEEREHLKAFWNIYRQYGDVRLVTFNGFKFDLPVIMRRSMYLDVPYPIINLDRYRSEHIDLWQRLSHNGAISAHSLSFYRKRFGFQIEDAIDGSQIAGLVKAGRWEDIRSHCLADVGTTHALANRLGILRIGVAA